MKHCQPEKSPRPDLDAAIRQGQLHLFFSAIPFSVQAIFGVTLILALVVRDQVDTDLIGWWLGVTALISLFRAWQYVRFSRTTLNADNSCYWWRQALISATASGLIWLLAELLLFPFDSTSHQLFFIFVIAGVAASTVTTMAPVFPGIVIFLLITITPIAWLFYQTTPTTGQLIGIMFLILVAIFLQSARRLNRMIVETLTMRHEKSLAEATIRRQALYDELTDLPNRRMLFDQLEREITRSRRHGHLGALLFLDLDHFKHINDSLGHAVGDRLLQQVARRLTSRLRTEDMVARLGGDEFVVILSEIGQTPEEALTVVQNFANELQKLFHRPFALGDHRLHVSASIGVVLFPLGEQGSSGALLQQADVAMYRAKDEGRDNVRIFQPSMQEALDRRLAIQRGLHQALEHGQLELYYQPQADIDGTVLGAEALVRWNHPDRGLVSPADFIPVAEESGLIYELGDWVITQVCHHIGELGETLPMPIAVNISPKQFREPGFAERILEIVNRTGIDPRLLHLEITESTVLENIDQTIAHMEVLKDQGIGFSIDDFGTGHSCLAYLKKLPIETLKIDRSFVRDILDDPNDAVLVETIIVMAYHLGLDVIAEGVENRQTLEFLWRKGCRKFQGYLFSRPLAFDDLRALPQPLLADHPRRALGS